MKYHYLFPLAISLVLGLSGNAQAVSITIDLNSGISFQNEGTIFSLEKDQTSLLHALDDDWAPGLIGFGLVVFDYYATGTDLRYIDAVSLNFDLSSVGWNNILSADLRFYSQKGNYGETSWGHYAILQGAFNPLDQDKDPIDAVGPIVDFGSAAPNATVDWLQGAISPSWITGDSFDVTLRLWNVRVDRVELLVDVGQAPEPSTMFLLVTGLLGVMRYARRSR